MPRGRKRELRQTQGNGNTPVPPPMPMPFPQQHQQNQQPQLQPTDFEYEMIRLLVNRVNLLEGILGFGDLTRVLNEMGLAVEYVENRDRINKIGSNWQNNLYDAQLLIMLLARQYAILYKAIEHAKLSEARRSLEELMSKVEFLQVAPPKLPPSTPAYT